MHVNRARLQCTGHSDNGVARGQARLSEAGHVVTRLFDLALVFDRDFLRK